MSLSTISFHVFLHLPPSDSNVTHFHAVIVVLSSNISILSLCILLCLLFLTAALIQIASLSLNFTPHIHLIIRISAQCNASSFSLVNGHVSLPCNVQLRSVQKHVCTSLLMKFNSLIFISNLISVHLTRLQSRYESKMRPRL